MARPTFSAGGAKQWASRRAISLQVAGMVGPEHEVIAGRRPVEEAFAARRMNQGIAQALAGKNIQTL